MENRKLTVKQKKFADNFIETGNATQAAIDAGYSKNTASVIASENLRKPNVKKYIDKQLKKIEDESIADATEVLQYLTRVMRGEEKEIKIVLDEEGQELKLSKPADIKDKTRAAELIGRRYALFTDGIEVEGELETNNPFKGLTTEELKEIINK